MEVAAFKEIKSTENKSFVVYAIIIVIRHNMNFLKVINKRQLKPSCVLTALFI